jgi:hypothetical protein
MLLNLLGCGRQQLEAALMLPLLLGLLLVCAGHLLQQAPTLYAASCGGF